METEPTTPEIVDDGQRRDRRGRVSWPRERREQLLAEYERSGMSQAAFARQVGVKYPTFAHWVQARRRDAAGQAAKAAPRFVELGVPRPLAAASGPLQVKLPDGLVVSGCDPRALAGLVQLLRMNAG